ncbi:MAG: DUF899 domain-containing protein [Alphaproteobacteria bacterium]|nr:DUF899 domain-containing protein [Alphaproteobacteria bacterium]
MSGKDSKRRIARLRGKIDQARVGLRSAISASRPQIVQDYVLATPKGETRLSQLFGEKRDLIVIHNMGTGCAYCTMWADGYNGLYPHLSDRAAFVVTSPDPPKRQAQFAKSRGWRFPMASHAGSSFAADMGFLGDSGRCLPGISSFRKQGRQIQRIAAVNSGPGDDFCAVWHFFDMLKGGAAGWTPKFRYG